MFQKPFFRREIFRGQLHRHLLPILSILLVVSMIVAPPLSAVALSAPTHMPARQDAPPSKGTVAVGSRDFTEQLLLGQIIIVLLEEAGYEVIDRTGLGGTNSTHDAIKSGEVDIIWEYIGTILAEAHNIPPASLPADTTTALDMVAALDALHHDLIWLTPSTFNDTYTFMVRADDTDLADLQSFAELADVLAADSSLRLCVENEFYSRNDGLFNLQQHYGFEFPEANIEIVAYGQLYEGLRDGLCDVAEGFSTDGRISAWNFRNLDDSEQFFPAYNASPVIRADTLAQYPEIGELLNTLGTMLDNDLVAELNARIDLGVDGAAASGDEETPREVATSFLNSMGLIKAAPITVSSKDYSEQLILGNVLKLLLEDAGYEVNDRIGLGGSLVVREAMLNGEIDIYMELTGTGLAVHNGLPASALPSEADRAYALAQSLDEPRGIIWLDRGEFNNTYAMMVRQELIDQEITSIDDLATYMNENDAPLTICVENDFFGRPLDGLLGMQERYGFEFKPENVLLMDLDGVYEALREGQCDVGEGYATDGRIGAWGLVNLEDSRAFFPFYNIAPVVRKDVLDANPELADLLNSFPQYLDDATMSQLNARVDIGADGVFDSGDEETPEDVAFSFLRSIDILSPPPVNVGSKDYTEQLILGQMLRHLLEDAGFPVNDLTGLGGSRVVRDAMLNGEIDVYMELTGTALAVYNELPASALPSEADRAYALAKSLDAPRGIIWLSRGEFNNTYAMMVREDLISEGIESIDDLAAYMNENDAPLTICVENDFYGRPADGLLAMQERYDFEFKPENVILSDLDSVYDALREGECDVAEGYATDGRIPAWGFTNLADSQGFFPFYNIAPVVRKELLDINPELVDLFNSFPHYLDDATMSQLNARVDLGADGLVDSGDEETPDEVALSFLQARGLLAVPSAATADAANADAPTEDASTDAADASSDTSAESSTETPTEGTTDESAEGSASNTQGDSAETTTDASDAAADTDDNVDSDTTSDDAAAPAPADAEESTDGAQFSGSQLLRDAVALLMGLGESGQLQPPQVVVRTLDSTQQRLLGQMIMLMLQDVGYDAVDQTGSADATSIRSAMEVGDIDVTVEAAADALVQYHNLPISALPENSERAYELASQLDTPLGITWLTPTIGHSGATLIIQQALADEGIATIADLSAYVVANDAPLTLCADEAFLNDNIVGLSDLQRVYGFDLEDDAVVTIEADQAYAAVRDGECSVAVGFSRDGRIMAWSLVALEDTEAFFPASPLAPVIRQEMLDDVPGLESFLGQIGEYLDNAALSDLSTRIEVGADGELDSGDEEAAQVVAQDFLCANGLLTNCLADATDTANTATDTEVDTAADRDAASAETTEGDGSAEDATAENEGATEEATAEQADSETDESAADAVAEAAETEATVTEDTANSDDEATVEDDDAESDDAATTVPPSQSIQVRIPENFGVNARATTSTEAEIYAVLPRGAALTAIARAPDNTWLQIQLPNGSQAWVFASAVLSTPEEIAQLPIVEPPALGATP